jgi:hypothetical protein
VKPLTKLSLHVIKSGRSEITASNYWLTAVIKEMISEPEVSPSTHVAYSVTSGFGTKNLS